MYNFYHIYVYILILILILRLEDFSKAQIPAAASPIAPPFAPELHSARCSFHSNEFM